MAVQAPTIRTADKDDEGPAKRHRRPARSCAECRMRKVKCDRSKPCGNLINLTPFILFTFLTRVVGACQRIRSVTCTFRPQRVGIRDESPAAASASASGGNDRDNERSARSSSQPFVPSNEFDQIVNTYVAPGIFGEHGRPKLKPLPTNRPGLDLSPGSHAGEATVIAGLLERIHALESRERARDGRVGCTSLQAGESTSTASGQFIKSKFYGQSHWINAMEPVCVPARCTSYFIQ
jgi:hypothetical protein